MRPSCEKHDARIDLTDSGRVSYDGRHGISLGETFWFSAILWGNCIKKLWENSHVDNASSGEGARWHETVPNFVRDAFC